MAQDLAAQIWIGLMSGTSVDGADGCAVRLGWREGDPAKGLAYEILGTHHQPIDGALRKQLLAVMNGEPLALPDLCALDGAVGAWLAECALNTLMANNLKPEDVTGIASHGQTIFHQPPTSNAPKGRTLQIGDPSVIAAATGIKTVADFRVADMAVGGHGAPLVPFADGWLFGDAKLGRCIQNIGGMGNVTVLPAGQYQTSNPTLGGQGPAWRHIRAFDTGPGNVWIDAAMAYFYGQPYDMAGAMAASGQLHLQLWQTLQQHPYMALPPPKSTGRETFGGHQLMALLAPLIDTAQPQDVVHTLTHFTAWSIADAYSRYVLPTTPIHQVILGGGGAKNPTLVKLLTAALSAACTAMGHKTPKVMTHQDFGIPDSAKEALAFAMLGWANLQGLPNNVPPCTGAAHPAILGKRCDPPLVALVSA
jgi:anhydro-N-acetylmuramic acid kinase